MAVRSAFPSFRGASMGAYKYNFLRSVLRLPRPPVARATREASRRSAREERAYAGTGELARSGGARWALGATAPAGTPLTSQHPCGGPLQGGTRLPTSGGILPNRGTRGQGESEHSQVSVCKGIVRPAAVVRGAGSVARGSPSAHPGPRRGESLFTARAVGTSPDSRRSAGGRGELEHEPPAVPGRTGAPPGRAHGVGDGLTSTIPRHRNPADPAMSPASRSRPSAEEVLLAAGPSSFTDHGPRIAVMRARRFPQRGLRFPPPRRIANRRRGVHGGPHRLPRRRLPEHSARVGERGWHGSICDSMSRTRFWLLPRFSPSQ